MPNVYEAEIDELRQKLREARAELADFRLYTKGQDCFCQMPYALSPCWRCRTLGETETSARRKNDDT